MCLSKKCILTLTGINESIGVDPREHKSKGEVTTPLKSMLYSSKNNCSPAKASRQSATCDWDVSWSMDIVFNPELVKAEADKKKLLK